MKIFHQLTWISCISMIGFEYNTVIMNDKILKLNVIYMKFRDVY